MTGGKWIHVVVKKTANTSCTSTLYLSEFAVAPSVVMCAAL